MKQLVIATLLAVGLGRARGHRALNAQPKRWQDGANLVLGVWLLVSPWTLNFFHDIGLSSLDFSAVGAAIAVLAAFALARRVLWSEWITLVLGLWMIGSPWLLGFASNRPAVPDAAAVGGTVALLSIWVILRYTPTPDSTSTPAPGK